MNDTLTEQVYRHLHQKLAKGIFQSGERLTNREVAKELGVSPTPVRSAFTRLVSEGVLRYHPNLGVFVPKANQREIRDIYEFREVLETSIVFKVCGQLDSAAFEEMQKCIEEAGVLFEQLENDDNSQKTAIVARWRLLDEAFHMAYIRAAGNRCIMDTVESLRARIHLVFGTFETTDNLKRAFQEHKQILAALKRGDAEEARRTIAEHIRRGCVYAVEACDRCYLGESRPHRSPPQSP